MKRVTLIITAVLTVLMLTACSSNKVVYESNTESQGGNKAWTVLIYMCGGDDESVNGDYSKKLDEIMNVNYSDNINVIVQTGGSSKWHTKNIYSDYCQRFKAGKNKLYLEDQSMAANMGDYNTLANFISWGTSKYKANHYMLILSGAGGGLINGMAYDELNGNDSLNLEEISYGISAAGVNFDMLSFDSSLMGSLEIAAEMSMCADYMTAPQDVIGNDEWNYEYVLQYLSDNPSTDSQGIGKAVCDGYYAKCEEKGTDKDAAMSCVALDNMSTLNQAFDGMAGDMLTATDSLLNYVNLSKAISGVQLYGGATVDEGFSNSVDLGDMAVKTSEFVGNTSDVLINTLNETVLYRVCGERKANSTGLALYYPLWENNDELQEYMEISNSVKYKEFLRKICTQCNVEDSSNTEDFNSSWAWNTYNQDMQTMEYKTILDGNSYELNILGNMDMFKSVDINVYKADKKSGNYTYIGKYSDLDGDWDAGVFKDNFNGKMLRLCGKNISVNLVGKYDGYEIYSAPIILNGKRSNVRIMHDTEKDSYKIIGAWGGLDSTNGRAYTNLKKIGFFDKITPILTVYDEEHNSNDNITGSWTLKMFGGVKKANISDGAYIFEYELTDIYGLKRRGTAVKANASGGNIRFE